eukprot:3170416-Rhodomonas_salina.1
MASPIAVTVVSAVMVTAMSFTAVFITAVVVTSVAVTSAVTVTMVDVTLVVAIVVVMSAVVRPSELGRELTVNTAMSTPRRTAALSRLPARGAIPGGRERRRAQIIVGVEVVEVVREVSGVGD